MQINTFFQKKILCFSQFLWKDIISQDLILKVFLTTDDFLTFAGIFLQFYDKNLCNIPAHLADSLSYYPG